MFLLKKGMDSFIEIAGLVFVGFVAGAINTLAGGGSLLTLPILIFLGLPPNIANATNRIAILFQNIFTTAGFKSKGIVTFPFSIYLGVSALFGSILGAQIATLHNLSFYLWLVNTAREKILDGTFYDWKSQMVKKLGQRL